MRKLPYNINDVLSRLTEFRSLSLEHSIVVILTDDYNINDIMDISLTCKAKETVPDFHKLYGEVFKRNCSKFIYVHNHPNNIPLPSNSDKDITYYIYNSCKRTFYSMVDHIILCSTGYYSFREKGNLSKNPNDYIF